jgi:hypothetical protein
LHWLCCRSGTAVYDRAIIRMRLLFSKNLSIFKVHNSLWNILLLTSLGLR